ncbi:MAG: histidine triad nucleotide-binding protein [Candidatus Krumholzibacteriia bacterium]
MPDCLFCKIAAGEIPADQVAADDHLLAFRDIDPQAPVHVLIIPRRHIPSVAALQDTDGEIMGRLMTAARDIAHREGVAERGFRVVINSGSAGGQSVDHLHVHLLGGRRMGWPPG